MTSARRLIGPAVADESPRPAPASLVLRSRRWRPARPPMARQASSSSGTRLGVGRTAARVTTSPLPCSTSAALLGLAYLPASRAPALIRLGHRPCCPRIACTPAGVEQWRTHVQPLELNSARLLYRTMPRQSLSTDFRRAARLTRASATAAVSFFAPSTLFLLGVGLSCRRQVTHFSPRVGSQMPTQDPRAAVSPADLASQHPMCQPSASDHRRVRPPSRPARRALGNICSSLNLRSRVFGLGRHSGRRSSSPHSRSVSCLIPIDSATRAGPPLSRLIWR